MSTLYSVELVRSAKAVKLVNLKIDLKRKTEVETSTYVSDYQTNRALNASHDQKRYRVTPCRPSRHRHRDLFFGAQGELPMGRKFSAHHWQFYCSALLVFRVAKARETKL